MSDAAPPVAPRRAAVIFVFITILLDMLALGMIVPVLPKLVELFYGGDTPQAARMYGLFGAFWALMQFVFSPLMGSLSDRFGRRPVILLSNFGLGLDYILMALAPDLRWLFIGRVISGITSASAPTAMAYITDVTPAEKRAGAYGLIGTAFGLGFILGPAIGGLLGQFGPRLPFWCAAAFSLANACYGTLVLPESLPADKRSPFSWRRANPVGSLRLLASHPNLLGLACVSVLSSLAHESLPSLFALYTGYRFNWSPSMLGLSLAVIGLGSALVQGVLVRHSVRRFGERATLVAGQLFGTTGFALYGSALASAQMWCGLPFTSLWMLGGPAATSLMARRVQPHEQGQLQGAINSIRGMTGMVGPLLFTQLFAWSVSPQANWRIPGMTYLLAACLTFSSAMVALLVTRHNRPAAAEETAAPSAT